MAVRVGVDVGAAMERFQPQAAGHWRASGLAEWLRALQGKTARAALTERAGFSVPQVGRWLRGEADPRLPQFLALLDALTGRAGDWVAELVDIDAVPVLALAVRSRREVLGLVYREPWTAAVLAALSTLPPHSDNPVGQTAATLGLSSAYVGDLVAVLERGGAVERTVGGFHVLGLTVDVPPDSAELHRIRRHWGSVSVRRLEAEMPDDRFSFNVCAVSRQDLERLLELQSAYFRELRAIVAASEPAEVVALMTMHTLSWAKVIS